HQPRAPAAPPTYPHHGSSPLARRSAGAQRESGPPADSPVAAWQSRSATGRQSPCTLPAHRRRGIVDYRVELVRHTLRRLCTVDDTERRPLTVVLQHRLGGRLINPQPLAHDAVIVVGALNQLASAL